MARAQIQAVLVLATRCGPQHRSLALPRVHGAGPAEVSRVLRPDGCFLLAGVRTETEVDAVRAQVRTSGLALLSEHVVTEPQESTEIPRVFRAQFQQFAGLTGSHIDEGLHSRQVVYFTWTLGKAGV